MRRGFEKDVQCAINTQPYAPLVFARFHVDIGGAARRCFTQSIGE